MRYTTLCYIEKDDKYLMLHRNKKENDENAGKWIGIGGHIEKYESITECLIREVREETGLILRNYRARGIVDFISDEWGEEKMFLFTADEFDGMLNTQPDGTVEDVCNEGELRWVKKSDVMDLELWEGDRIFLEELANDAPFFFLELRYQADSLVSHTLGGKTFAEQVYQAVSRIPAGKVATYGEIACLSGHPGAARAVGTALHKNPYEGIIPCHRVVNARYELADEFVFGGPGEQQRRLEAEGVKVVNGRVTVMDLHVKKY